MKKSIYAILALSVLFASCDSWVENAETPSNTLTRDQLNKSAMVANIQSNSITDGPLVAYVKTLQGDASAAAFLALGTTVDELTEGTIPNALLLSPKLRQITSLLLRAHKTIFGIKSTIIMHEASN